MRGTRWQVAPLSLRSVLKTFRNIGRSERKRTLLHLSSWKKQTQQLTNILAGIVPIAEFPCLSRSWGIEKRDIVVPGTLRINVSSELTSRRLAPRITSSHADHTTHHKFSATMRMVDKVAEHLIEQQTHGFVPASQCIRCRWQLTCGARSEQHFSSLCHTFAKKATSGYNGSRKCTFEHKKCLGHARAAELLMSNRIEDMWYIQRGQSAS